MKSLRLAFVLACVLSLTGCYAATIDTGRPVSTKVIEKKWASSWIYGLVPPTMINTAADCPNGVAKVETQLSFLNQVVGLITWGIYTPMQIVVTCAEGAQGSLITPEPEIQVAFNASTDDMREAFGKAAQEAVQSGRPVYVRMTH
jgi:hypothetical protein